MSQTACSLLFEQRELDFGVGLETSFELIVNVNFSFDLDIVSWT